MAERTEHIDPGREETREWLDSLEYVLENDGVDRANFLLERLSARMTKTGARLPYTITTPYRNTIPSSREAFMPGDLFMERRIRSLVRWNALAMVVRANSRAPATSVATFPPSHPWQPCTMSASTTSSGAPMPTPMVSRRAISSIFRATLRRASMPGRSWKGG